MRAEPIESQIQQARQFDERVQATKPEAAQTGIAAEVAQPAEDETDLGAQAILKREESPRSISLFSDVSGYYTDNVALTREGRLHDGFLVATFGGSYEPKLTDNLHADLTFRGAMFRYNEFSRLDFNSVDASAGLSYRLKNFYDATIYARYNFTDLISARSDDEFFQNHAFTLGVQKVFPFARSHYALIGASAQWGIANLSSAQRDEYTVYGAYHLDLTRRFSGEVGSRSSFYYYKQDRRDFNETLSATLRYKFNDWLSIGATASLAVNNSNRAVFDYHAFNVGGGIAVNAVF